MIQIFQQRERCIGCAYCVEVAPHFWEMDYQDGKCNLIGSRNRKGISFLEALDEDYEVNLKAAQNCPVGIIRVEKRKI